MIEIIISIILQITTILNGGDNDKQKAEKDANNPKAKTEQNASSTPAAAEGGQSGWEG